jgi:hypothetical protein
MKKLTLLVGPVLFLVAQTLWPGGSADDAQRVEMIRQNPQMWVLSHQLFVLAFAFLAVWLISAYTTARGSALATVGAFFTGFALLADYAIAIEQIMSVAVITSPLGGQSVDMLVLLPYTIGFLIGLPALGIALWRAGVLPLGAGLIALAGVLLVAAGILGVKPLFILAAVALLAGSAWVAFLPSAGPGKSVAGLIAQQ